MRYVLCNVRVCLSVYLSECVCVCLCVCVYVQILVRTSMLGEIVTPFQPICKPYVSFRGDIMAVCVCVCVCVCLCMSVCVGECLYVSARVWWFMCVG